MISSFSILLIYSLFFSISFSDFSFKVDHFHTRVWPPCFALPLNLVLWWFFKERNFSLSTHNWFLYSLIVASVALTLWKVDSDLKFYKHQKDFSKLLSTFQGVVKYPEVKKLFQNVSSTEQIHEASIIYPRSRTIKAILIIPEYFCDRHCLGWYKNSEDCSLDCTMKTFDWNKRGFNYLSNSRFFALIKSGKGLNDYCK